MGVSSGVFTGSDFAMPSSSPKPAVQIMTVPASKAVNNTTYYDGVSKKTYAEIVKGSIPSTSTVSNVKTGLDLVGKTPKITPAHLLVGAVASGALYGLNQLYPDSVSSPLSVVAPSPAVSSVPSAIVPNSSTPPQTINEKTVQIINNFSPEILGKLKVESDTDLITALVNASVAQNQSSIMNTSVLNTQLGMLNEQFYGLLAYLDLFLESVWDGNELLALNTASNYDIASEGNAVNDTIAESVLNVSDKLTHFSDNQDWLKTSSPVPSFSGALSPRDAEFAKNYELGRGESDTNSLGFETLEDVEELFSDMDLTPDMFKNYIRFDTILNQVAADVDGDGDVDSWEQLMEDFFK